MLPLFNLLDIQKSYLIYNTEVDTLKGGEKSRFITQLEVEGIHNIKHKIISPKTPKINIEGSNLKNSLSLEILFPPPIKLTISILSSELNKYAVTYNMICVP